MSKEVILDKPVKNWEVLTINDSNDPSFTRLVLPYRVICRQRYHKAGVEQRQQFIKELRRQEMCQVKALDGVRLHRQFSNPIITPYRPTEIVRISPKQKFRIEQILKDEY